MDGSKALILDGSDDYVMIPGFAFGGEMTLCTHVKFDAFNTWSRVLDASANPAGQQNGQNLNIVIANEAETSKLMFVLLLSA